MYKILSLERYGFILVILFVLFGWFGYILGPVIVGFWNIFHLSFTDLANVLGGF
jgi:fucose permease